MLGSVPAFPPPLRAVRRWPYKGAVRKHWKCVLTQIREHVRVLLKHRISLLVKLVGYKEAVLLKTAALAAFHQYSTTLLFSSLFCASQRSHDWANILPLFSLRIV